MCLGPFLAVWFIESMRPLRIFREGKHHLITNRCNQEALHLVPSDSVNEILVRNLHLASKRYQVPVRAFVFMSNHFHLIIERLFGVPQRHLELFMCFFESRVAQEIHLLSGGYGHFWQGRYHSKEISSNLSLERAVQYVLDNPIRAGLVSSLEEYPGVVSHNEHYERNHFTVMVLDRQAWRRAGRPKDKTPYCYPEVFSAVALSSEARFIPSAPVPTVPAPVKASPKRHHKQRECGLLYALMGKVRPGKVEVAVFPEEEAKYVAVMKRFNQQASHGQAKGSVAPLGRAGILSQMQGSIPKSYTDRSKRKLEQEKRARSYGFKSHPLVLADTDEEVDEYREMRKAYTAAYRHAADEYKLGNLLTEFPEGAFPPTGYPIPRYSLDSAA